MTTCQPQPKKNGQLPRASLICVPSLRLTSASVGPPSASIPSALATHCVGGFMGQRPGPKRLGGKLRKRASFLEEERERERERLGRPRETLFPKAQSPNSTNGRGGQNPALFWPPRSPPPPRGPGVPGAPGTGPQLAAKRRKQSCEHRKPWGGPSLLEKARIPKP